MGIGKLVYADARCDLFSCLKLENVNDILSACGASCLGDHICLAHLYLTRVGEHQEIRVAVERDNLFDKVLFLGGHTDHTSTTAMLCGVNRCGLTLDITCVGECDNAAVTLNEILKNDLVLCRHNVGATSIGILATDLTHFILNDLLDLAHIGKNALELCNQRVQACEFFFNLASLHTRQLTKCHFNNGLCLNFGEPEALHQGLL